MGTELEMDWRSWSYCYHVEIYKLASNAGLKVMHYKNRFISLLVLTLTVKYN